MVGLKSKLNRFNPQQTKFIFYKVCVTAMEFCFTYVVLVNTGRANKTIPLNVNLANNKTAA